MSQIRGTKFSLGGPDQSEVLEKVERSLLAVKYAVPPLASVPYRMPRPITWLIGMKLSVINGSRPAFVPVQSPRLAPDVGDLPRG